MVRYESMGILDKIKKQTDNYITVSHFIKQLSGTNNFPVYDVITYLNHHNFVEKIHAFHIDMDLKIIPFHSVDYQNLQASFDKLQLTCLGTNFIWTDGNFDKVKKELVGFMDLEPFYKLADPYNSMHWYFKKQDLADFEPLEGYTDFLGVKATPKQYPLFYKNDFFDLTECESMITGYDPNDGWQCLEREQAYSLVLASVHNGKFKPHPHRENDYLISADDFREWLISKDIFIDGFTNISTQKTPTTQNQPTDLQQENERLQARIAELEQQLNDQPTTNPVANITQEMQIINEVYSEFWKNHKSNEIPPKKETIVSWIKSEYGISDRIAQAIDTIVRPEQYRTGGQKAR